MDDVNVTTVEGLLLHPPRARRADRKLRQGLQDRCSRPGRKLLEQPTETSSYKQELTDFDLAAVRVTPDALVLVVEFKLVVK